MTAADTASQNPYANPQAAARRVLQALSAELQLPAQQIQSAIELMDSGATVPFIARYRKEVTGGMSDDHLRTLEERLLYLRELEDRRAVVLQSIAEQGKLTPELQAAPRHSGAKGPRGRAGAAGRSALAAAADRSAAGGGGFRPPAGQHRGGRYLHPAGLPRRRPRHSE